MAATNLHPFSHPCRPAILNPAPRCKPSPPPRRAASSREAAFEEEAGLPVFPFMRLVHAYALVHTCVIRLASRRPTCSIQSAPTVPMPAPVGGWQSAEEYITYAQASRKPSEPYCCVMPAFSQRGQHTGWPIPPTSPRHVPACCSAPPGARRSSPPRSTRIRLPAGSRPCLWQSCSTASCAFLRRTGCLLWVSGSKHAAQGRGSQGSAGMTREPVIAPSLAPTFMRFRVTLMLQVF